jgi:hypothetical protein
LAGIPNPRYVIAERRESVNVLLSQNLTEIEIAKRLNVNQATISRDVRAIKKESQTVLLNISKETLPYEYGKCLNCVNRVIKECWDIFQDKSNKWSNKDKINALRLIKEATMTRCEIVYNGPVTLEAQHYREKLDKLIDENSKIIQLPSERGMTMREQEPPPM